MSNSNSDKEKKNIYDSEEDNNIKQVVFKVSSNNISNFSNSKEFYQKNHIDYDTLDDKRIPVLGNQVYITNKKYEFSGYLADKRGTDINHLYKVRFRIIL